MNNASTHHLRISLLSRRETLTWMASGLAGIAIGRSAHAQTLAKHPGASGAAAILNLPITKCTLSSSDIYGVLFRLLFDFRVPICFSEGDTNPRVNIDVKQGTVRDVLKQIETQAPQYKVREINGRLLVASKQPLLNTVVAGVHIVKVPRWEAMQQYLAFAQMHIPGLEILQGPLRDDEPREPFNDASVTLSPKASLLEHLMQLIGGEPELTFALLRSQSVVRVWFKQAPRPKPSTILTKHSAEDVLCLPVTDLMLSDMPISQVIMTLLSRYRAALCFVGSDMDVAVSVEVKQGTVRDVLKQITAQAPAYQIRMLANRVVFGSHLPVLDTIISGLKIVKAPRYHAFLDYLDYARAHVPELAHIGYPGRGGEEDAPFNAAPITLRPAASLLEHLIELMGNDSTAAFALIKVAVDAPIYSGYRFFLQQVDPPEPH